MGKTYRVKVGAPAVVTPPGPGSFPAPFNDTTNTAWRPRVGESVYDNMPAGAPVVNIGDYSSSTDLYDALMAVRGGTTGGVYVQLAARDYFINNCKNYGTVSNPAWFGFHNGSAILGLIGAGFDGAGEFLTRIVAVSTMVSSTPGARDAILGATSAVVRSATALYFSDNTATWPLFFSGIAFDGDLQGPFGQYTTAAQAAFSRYKTAVSPIAWYGFAFWVAHPQSRMQFCRFRGFAFALNSAPPFECGSVQSNKCNLITFGVEVDGRIAGWLNPARPRAGGGWMWNKETDILAKRFFIHHTRRSGNAINTNTANRAEKYFFDNFQATDIANLDTTPTDVWPSDGSNGSLGFNGTNIEAVIGLVSLTDYYATIVHSHCNIAMPYDTGQYYLAPNTLALIVNGFKTDDTIYGGALRVSTVQRPNGTVDSQVYTAIAADGANYAAPGSKCDQWFDIRPIKDGPRATPVKASLWNDAIHDKFNNYCLRSF